MNTPPDKAAIAIHEMYVSLVRAGFNEQQALFICGVWMASQPAKGNTDA